MTTPTTCTCLYHLELRLSTWVLEHQFYSLGPQMQEEVKEELLTTRISLKITYLYCHLLLQHLQISLNCANIKCS